MADRCVTKNNCCSLPSGSLILQEYDGCGGLGPEGFDPFPALEVGEVESLSVDITTTEKTLKSYRSRAGGNVCSVTDIDSILIKATGSCVSPDNVARLYGGSNNKKAAQTNVSFVGKIRRKDENTFVQFLDSTRQVIGGVDPASVNLIAPAGLVNGLDYSVSSSGITFFADAPNLVGVTIPVTGIPVTGDLDHGAFAAVELLTNLTKTFRVIFDGFDKSKGIDWSFTGYRGILKPLGNLPLISDDFAKFSFEFTLLPDTFSKGVGVSKYGAFAFPV